MISRAEFLAAVMTTIGTPFQHRGRIVGVGLDCIGVPIAALALCGVRLPEPPPYGRFPGSVLHDLGVHGVPIAPGAQQPGDLVAIMWAGEPRHVAVFVDRAPDGEDVIVHALARVGKVAMHPFGRRFQVHSYWRLREVA